MSTAPAAPYVTVGLALTLLAAAAALAAYWLLHVTEGAYLGARVVRLLYDRTAHTYDDIKGFRRHEEVESIGLPLLQRLEARGDETRPLLVLDVATGTARVPLALLDIPFFDGRVIGVDASRKMLDIAARKTDGFGDRVALLHHAAAPLPFRSDAFDAVTSLEALEFFPDRHAALREMARVLRPGGTLLVTNRIGVDALLMPGKTDRPDRFEHRLTGLGLVEVRTRRWQTYYALVWARKPYPAPASEPDSVPMAPGSAGETRWPWWTVAKCPRCGADAEWAPGSAGVVSCRGCGLQANEDGLVWRLSNPPQSAE